MGKGVRGREITFMVQPAGFANARLRSASHHLCDGFSWCLLVFPLGTETTTPPKQVAAFVELVPTGHVEASWIFRRIEYTITLVNWANESDSIVKEHTFDFSHTEADNGWHRGWVTLDSNQRWVTADARRLGGWLSDDGKLC